MTHTLRRGGGGQGAGAEGEGGGLACVLDVQSLFFFIKENKICAKTRHHANNILLAGNLPFDSYLRQ